MKNPNSRDFLKKMISKNTSEFFENYSNTILLNSKENNLIMSVEGRFREIKNQQIKGIISNEQLNLEMNKIRSSLLDFVDQIEPSRYIPNLDSDEIRKVVLSINNNTLESNKLIKEQGKHIESLNYQLSQMQQEIDKLKLKILERSILSIDTHDANLESYFISDYIQICKKYDNSTVKYELDKIIDAVVKYSKKYPNLIDSEKLIIINNLNSLNLNIVNKKKIENIMENFKLK